MLYQSDEVNDLKRREFYEHCGLRETGENGDIRDKSELDGRFTTLLRLIEPPIRSS